MKNILRLSRILLKPYKFRIILIIFFALLVSNSPYVFSLLGRWLVDDVLMKPAVTAPVDDSSPVSNTGEDPDQPALTAVENTNYEEADAAAEDNASPAVEDKASPAIVPEKPSGGILRNLSLPEEPERALLLFFMVSVGIHLAITLMSLMSEFSTSHIVQAGTHDLRGELNEKFNTSDMVFFNREQVGQMMTRIMDDTGAVPGNLLNFVVNTITHIGTLIIGILLLLRLNPLMGLVVLGLVPFYAGACLLLLPRIKSNTELTREKWSQLIGHAVERLQNIITVKNYAQEERESTQFKERVSVSLGLNRQNIKLNLIFGILTAAVSAIGTTAVLAYGFLLIKSGKMRLGEVLAFYQVTAQLFVPLSALAGMTTVVQTLRIYAERIFGVLNSSDSIPEPDSQQADITAFIFNGQVSFNGVTLRYMEGGPFAVNDLTFSLPAGKLIFLTGQTGCGKSSVLWLLTRLYDPTLGSIMIDGIDIRKIPVRRLRLMIGNVMNESSLFSGSILENITYGAAGLSLSKVEESCRILGLSDWIQSLPNGLNTMVGAGGLQPEDDICLRINVARAGVTNPAVITLDDPFSGIEDTTAVSIISGLRALCPTATILVASSSLSLCRNGDMILVMRQGRVIESGTHEQLSELKGLYNRMFLRQMGQMTE